MRSFHTLRKHQNTRVTSLVLLIILAVAVFLAGFKVPDIQIFFSGFALSFFRVSLAYVISLVGALLLALVATANAKAESIAIPILDVLQSFPSFALFPLLLVFFGSSSIVTIAILVVSMIWPLVFTIVTGRKQIKDELLDAAYIFNARGLKFYQHFLFPLLFPAIITGSIIAWGEAWETIIAAEIIVQIKGVGTYLAEIPTSQPQVLAVGIIALMTLLFFVNKYFWLKLLSISTKYQQE